MSYDLNGNTLNDGTNSYTWDARNRLVSADNSAATFAYDALGRRMSKTIQSANTSFLYDGVNPVQELNGTTPTANLLTGGIDQRFTRTDANGTLNYLTDALGSTIALTDTSGNSQAQYSYDPYGNMNATGSTTNSYTYTGREFDGLGLYYYRARYYNPATGRFVNEDPIGFDGGINKYAYVDGDPISNFDPFGMDKTVPSTCSEDEQMFADLAPIFAQTSELAGSLSAVGFLGVGVFAAGEGITFGIDTPGTITFLEFASFFAETSIITGTEAALANSVAHGNLAALQDFTWSQLANIAGSGLANSIPALDSWAEDIGDLTEKLEDLTSNTESACQVN